MLGKLGIFFLAIGLAKIAWYLIWKDRHDQTATEKAFLEEIEAQLYEMEN